MAETKVAAVQVGQSSDLGYNLEGKPKGPACELELGNGKKKLRKMPGFGA